MELYVFAANFPELYAMLNNAVRDTIAENNMTGAESLRDWDDMIDDFVRRYENDNNYGQEMRVITSQQMPYVGFGDRDGRDRDGRDRNRDRDRDRNRDRDRRRFRDFNLRDIIRLLFLRQMFDRDRR